MIVVEIRMPPGIVALPQVIAKALPEIAKELENDIRSEAQRTLRSTRKDYKDSLKLAQFPIKTRQLKRTSVKFAVITLNGWLANALETGWEGGNMVGWLVKGRSGNGKFATIRFRHTGQGTSGAHGTPMGEMEHRRGGMSRQQAALVGKAITRAASKTLTENAAPPKLRSVQHESRMSANTAAKAGGLIMRGKAKGARSHSSSVYTGMTKRKDTAGTSYETFRRASVNVPGKWIHPGISANHFFDKALRHFPKRVDRMINHVVEGMRGVK